MSLLASSGNYLNLQEDAEKGNVHLRQVKMFQNFVKLFLVISSKWHFAILGKKCREQNETITKKSQTK